MVASRSHRDLREELSLEGIKMKGRKHVLRREGKRQKGDKSWSFIQSPCPHYFSSYLLYWQGEDIIRNEMEVKRQEREEEKSAVSHLLKAMTSILALAPGENTTVLQQCTGMNGARKNLLNGVAGQVLHMT